MSNYRYIERNHGRKGGHRGRLMIYCNGKLDSIDGWSVSLGIPKSTIQWRLDEGKDIEESLGLKVCDEALYPKSSVPSFCGIRPIGEEYKVYGYAWEYRK